NHFASGLAVLAICCAVRRLQLAGHVIPPRPTARSRCMEVLLLYVAGNLTGGGQARTRRYVDCLLADGRAPRTLPAVQFRALTEQLNDTNYFDLTTSTSHGKFESMSAEDVASLVVLSASQWLLAIADLEACCWQNYAHQLLPHQLGCRRHLRLVQLCAQESCSSSPSASGSSAPRHVQTGCFYVQFVCLASPAFLLLAMTVDRYEASLLKKYRGANISTE
uniref:DUF4220 domain-containing protein n=1 Tax=Macrostomum lignano TaxID=282301 RepID=A0A1I8F742_9PLAT